ncbi:hypothetical protein L2725_12790 [Shewanella corallii]|uniref:DUF3019 domain-containing protein n=1 Tax=Shewanella corallii TaxID=560080 RepID=A0ABT0N935_9GAMM|nr:hypothetical protein [Shewanella corallii]MCL2914645.1 hypothetical protein [Shewanella corallii]
MKLFTIFCFTLISVFSANSEAADYVIRICDMQSHSNSNSAYIRPCDYWSSKNGCPGTTWLTWDMSKFQGQAMYSTAMAALVADKKVTVRLDGRSCSHYDITSMIRLHKN